MTAPFIFINMYAIKEGRLEGFRNFLQETLKVLEVNAPRILAVSAYLNEEGTEVAIVQAHQDAASIRDYWQTLHRHSGRALEEYVEPAGVQIFGAPGDLALTRTRHFADSGATASVMPESLGGFTRLAPAR